MINISGGNDPGIPRHIVLMKIVQQIPAAQFGQALFCSRDRTAQRMISPLQSVQQLQNILTGLVIRHGDLFVDDLAFFAQLGGFKEISFMVEGSGAYSRFKFESAVFEECKDAFLFPETLKNLMLKAQKEGYGKGLDPEYLHPYMWACKSHYYSSGLSFYNFPYAFGALFSKGLYAMYKKEGASFVPKYQKMLLATTVNSVEDTAKTMGIDLTKKDFWRGSLDLVKAQIDEFLELTKDM